MLTITAALPAGQSCETSGVLVESDGYDEVEIVGLTPLEIDLQSESIRSDQDEGRIVPELRELQKRFRLLGKKARH